MHVPDFITSYPYSIGKYNNLYLYRQTYNILAMFYLHTRMEAHVLIAPFDIDKLTSKTSIMNIVKRRIQGVYMHEHGLIIEPSTAPETVDVKRLLVKSDGIHVTVEFKCITFNRTRVTNQPTKVTSSRWTSLTSLRTSSRGRSGQ